MKRLALGLCAVAALTALPAVAALKEGAKAPDFTLPAALGGKDFTYTLASELKKGPAVVYFYPKAFTKGCSAEAHEFAENIDNFKAMGASVIGVSGDNIKALEEFSTKDCASKFPVAADPAGEVIAKYDVNLKVPGAGLMLKMDHPSDRTSFLVAPDGTIIATYSALDASKHVSTMLDALKKWRETHKA
jgi:thioredoxin-dependent peroxiredoxin